ncbi:MAG: hypothetical protein LUD69_08025 [Oscillospiraceae bacterium]|nr:hypothetical protein [Oscillospiraceae bacterium]
MYTMILSDSTKVTFSGMNGTNYIVPDRAEMDTSIFTDDNLASGTITDEDGNMEEFSNWAFIQQQKQPSGDYYICFRQKTDQELADEARDSYITTLEDALIELYEAML